MIEKKRVEFLRRHWALEISVDEVEELFRVYLAWMEAPEAKLAWSFGDEGEYTFEIEASYETKNKVDGKRVRLVEVKE